MLRYPRQSGFTLIELLIVVALLSLVVGMLIPNANPSLRDQLEGAAEILSGDIAFARSLAVANDSSYRITFDFTQNQYVLTHTGTNPALNNLPHSPYALPSDPADQHIVRLASLPHLGGTARLHAVRALSTSPQSVSDLEFGSLGETTRPEETQIWIAVGTGTATRYLSVRVNPVTGLTWIENFQATEPVAPAGGADLVAPVGGAGS
jgi:prepilin-type N-terminal cleavage/methylation domain-containing protein